MMSADGEEAVGLRIIPLDVLAVAFRASVVQDCRRLPAGRHRAPAGPSSEEFG